MNNLFSRRIIKILFIILTILLISGVSVYLYFYAPLGKIKNLNRATINQCNQYLKDQNQVLCLFNENTKKLEVLPIKVNAIGYALDSPINNDNNLRVIELKAQLISTSYSDMQEIRLYQFNSLTKIRTNNVLILSINLPKILQNTLHNVGSGAYEIINKPEVPISVCFGVEPINPEKGNIGGEYIIHPSSLIFSKSTENDNVFCTKSMKLEKYPILTYINKLPKASQERNDYFGIKIFLPPSNMYQKSLTTNDFESNFESFLPFYRYRIPFITTIIKELK